jgi:hypothetical protein
MVPGLLDSKLFCWHYSVAKEDDPSMFMLDLDQAKARQPADT